MISVIEDFVLMTQAEVEKSTRRVISGSCENMAEYEGLCAEIKAYKRTIENIRKVMEKYYDESEG